MRATVVTRGLSRHVLPRPPRQANRAVTALHPKAITPLQFTLLAVIREQCGFQPVTYANDIAN
jgi:hypothetical protein